MERLPTEQDPEGFVTCQRKGHLGGPGSRHPLSVRRQQQMGRNPRDRVGETGRAEQSKNSPPERDPDDTMGKTGRGQSVHREGPTWHHAF